jgi:hypothetical protein
MGSDDGAREIMKVPVELALRVGWGVHGREKLRPAPRPLPAGEAAGHGAPRAIALGQITPGRPRAQNPEQAMEDASMLNRRPAGLGVWWGEQRLPPFPWRWSYISSVHTHEYNAMNRVCKHTLVIRSCCQTS